MAKSIKTKVMGVGSVDFCDPFKQKNSKNHIFANFDEAKKIIVEDG